MKEWINNRKQGIIVIIIATLMILLYLALKDRPGKAAPAQYKDSVK